MLSLFTLVSICVSTAGLAAAQSIDPNSVSQGTRSKQIMSQVLVNRPLISACRSMVPRPDLAMPVDLQSVPW
jgi:hypothetical protein